MKPDRKAERRCGLCRRGVEAEDVCGRLWVDDDCVAHKKCMVSESLKEQLALATQFQWKDTGD